MARTRANGEGNIRRRKDGRWEVRITKGINFMTGEVQRVSKYAPSQEEAIKLLHTLSYTMDRNPNLNNTALTLGQWMDVWLTVYMKNSLKQSTYLSYEGYIKNHFKPAFDGLPIRDLTPRLLQQFYNFKSEQARLAPKTISNMNLCLHKALDHAVKEGILLSNPASAVNLPRGPKAQIEILTRDEQAMLVRASYNHRYGVFIRLVLVTGLRLGELLGLRWVDIDLRSNMLNIRQTLNRLNKMGLTDDYDGPRTEIVIQPPKSQNSLRSIPLLPAVVKDLLAWRGQQEADKRDNPSQYVDSGMVVTNPLGGYIEPRTFKDYYEQTLARAGLRRFTFHALRHTFASRALEQGMDIKTLSILLGHYSVSFTLDTYTHVLNDHKWEGMQLMEDLCSIDRSAPQNMVYPVVISPTGDGNFMLHAPDFPQVQYVTPDVEVGLQAISGLIHEALYSMVYPPAATSPETEVLMNGQIVVQVLV